MTQKELLYLEDLLGAEDQANKICSDFAPKAQDQQFKDHFTALAAYHKQNVAKLYAMLK